MAKPKKTRSPKSQPEVITPTTTDVTTEGEHLFVTISAADRDTLLEEFAAGVPKAQLQEKYGITYYMLNRIVQNHQHTLKEIQFQNNAVHFARENRKIAEVKEHMLEHALAALERTAGQEKLTDFQLYENLLSLIDKIQRLNDGQATEHIQTDSTTTTTHLDVAQTLAQLKTPEDKKKFLLNQISDVRTSQHKK